MLGDPNDLALVLLFPISFAASLIMTKGSHWSMKLLGLVAVPILFSAIIATQSRGGLLGMLAVFGVFAYRRIRSKTLFITIGIILAITLFSLAGVSERASGGAAEDGIDESAMGRIYAWEAAYYMALHNPVTGVGINNFYANYFFYSQFWDGKPHAVHSTWFGVLAETGFIGLFIFIAMIIMLVISARRSLEKIQSCNEVPVAIHSAAQAVLAGMTGTIISGSFLTQGFIWPLYILMALIVALSHWVKTFRS
jgi:O-antigen ligase